MSSALGGLRPSAPLRVSACVYSACYAVPACGSRRGK